jgi:Tfp pilus assembly protein FimT
MAVVEAGARCGRGKRQRRIRSARGFSVLEVTATVVVTLVLACVLLPQLGGMMERARLNGATRTVVADIMQARMAAVGSNRPYELSFMGDSSYVIRRDDNRDGVFAGDETLEVVSLGSVYAGVSVESSETLVFSPRGTVGSATIVLKNAKGKRKVHVNVAGRVKVQS